MEHFSEDLLSRFFEGMTDRKENRQVVRHLLTQCSLCSATLNRIIRTSSSGAAFEPALDRCEERLRKLLTVCPVPTRRASRAIHLL